MGRWDHWLFGHDDAIGHAIKISKDIARGDDRQFVYILGPILLDCPPGVFGYYRQEYSLVEKLGPLGSEESMNQLILRKLDSGLSDELFEKYRAAEKQGSDFGDVSKYLVIVFAAMMMRYGAVIKEDHIQHLRDLVPKINCNEVMAGRPRSFLEASCHGCGKVNDDIKADGKVLMKCGGCETDIAAAWFCDKTCQRGLWRHHKHNCGAPPGPGTAIFRSYGKRSFGVIAYDGDNV